MRADRPALDRCQCFQCCRACQTLGQLLLGWCCCCVELCAVACWGTTLAGLPAHHVVQPICCCAGSQPALQLTLTSRVSFFHTARVKGGWSISLHLMVSQASDPAALPAVLVIPAWMAGWLVNGLAGYWTAWEQ